MIWKALLRFRYPESECLCAKNLYLGSGEEPARELHISRYSAGLLGLRIALDGQTIGSPDRIEQHVQSLDWPDKPYEFRETHLRVDAGVNWGEVLYVMSEYQEAARSPSREVYFAMDID